jgi:hypothetical protein
MEKRSESDDFDLLVKIPSPTQDSKREMVIWMDRDEPSVAFGEWHTHSTVWVVEAGSDNETEALLELIHAVMKDEFVFIYDVVGEHDGHWGVVNLRDPSALAEELTNRHSPGRVIIKTWTGSGDHEVGLEDPKIG